VTVSPPYPLAVSWPSTSTVVTPSGSSTPLASGEGRLGRVIVTELHRGVLLPVLAEHPPAVGVALRTVVRRADGHVERGAPSPSGLVSTSVTSGKRAPAPPVSPASVDAVQPVSASTSKQTRRSAEGKVRAVAGKAKMSSSPSRPRPSPPALYSFMTPTRDRSSSRKGRHPIKDRHNATGLRSDDGQVRIRHATRG